MQFKITSTDIISDNIVAGIANNTGVNNYTSSSKMKNIADAISDEVSNVANSANLVLGKMYTSTASDDALDANGYQNDTYRKNNNSVIIQSTDQLVQIEPIAGTFNPAIYDIVLLPAQTQLALGDNIVLTFLEDLIITSLDVVKYISIRLEATGTSAIQIASGDLFRLNTLQNPYLSDLTLVINTNITTYTSKESDTSYRERIISKKNSPYASVESAITNELLAIDGVVGVGYTRLYFGAANIGILTNEMFLTGIDTYSAFTLQMANNKIYQFAPAGAIYNVFVPEPIHLKLDVNLVAANYDLDFVKSTILKVFQDKYKYSDINTIYLSSLNREIHRLIPSQDIRITEAQLYLPTIDGTILTSEEEVKIPLYGFAYLLTSNINIEIVSNVWYCIIDWYNIWVCKTDIKSRLL